MTLPDWIKYDTSKGHYVLFDSCICNKCNFKWFPRINQDSSLKLKMCPKCKSHLWNNIKN